MRIPSEADMIRSYARIYFPQNDVTIVTQLLPNGRWGAGFEDDGHMPGEGATQLEAIADLVEQTREG